MRFSVLIKKYGDTKKAVCRSLQEAMDYAEWGAFLLDIKIKKTLPKKDWKIWSYDTCFFEYDITSDAYKECAFTYVRIRSEQLPMELYGKNNKQIEKYLRKKPGAQTPGTNL